MQTAKEAREARRRRILERGSDRLAYITGELKASPVSPKIAASIEPTSTNHHTDDVLGSELGNPESSKEETNGSLVETTSDRGGGSQRARIGPGASIPVEGGVSELRPSQAGDTLEHEIQATISRFQTPLSLANSDGNPGFDSLSSIETSKSPNGNKTRRSRSSTMRLLSDTIDASEGVRGICALILAVILICQIQLLTCGHPWGNVLNSWLPRWPISLVFFTDIAIVVGTFLLHPADKLVEEEEKGVSPEVDGNRGPLSKALDIAVKLEDLLNIGLLCKKAAGAISLDCSIYIVVLVCGLSLVRYWFSSCALTSP